MLPNTPEVKAALALAKKISDILVEQGVHEAVAASTVKDVLLMELFGQEMDDAGFFKLASGFVKESRRVRSDAAMVNMAKFKPLLHSMSEYQSLHATATGRTFRLMGLLEDASGGIRGGEVATIVARSGAYKTCILENLLINQARELARYELPGILLFFSFEMPEEGIAERAIQATTKSSVDQVVAATANDDQWGALMQSVDGKEALKKIYCYYGEPLTVEEMAALTLDMEFIQPVHGIAIDYLGYLKSKGAGSRYEKVSEIARELKTGLARKLNIPVIQLSQANRMEGKDGTEEITLASARDSGAVEESADFMYGFWKEEKEGEKPQLWGRILKERRHFQTHGSMNPYFKVEFEPGWMLLQNIAEVRKSQVPSQKKNFVKRVEV